MKPFMTRLGRLFLLTLIVCLLMGSALAADNGTGELKKGDAIDGTSYIVTSVKTYTIAPDITEKVIITNNSSGTSQTVANVMEVNLNNNQAKIVAGYGNLNPKTQGWTLKTTTDQAHLYENAYNENVVGGINAAIFNTETGEPAGHLVMRGVQYQENTNYAFVAVFDDGSVGMFGKGVTLAQAAKQQSESLGYTVKIQEAISGWIVLVDGDTVATKGTNVGNYSRSAIGMKEDGTIVMIEADGSLLPRSNGYTLAEMGYMMKALGCTYAIELDEGGSSTYISQRASEDDVTMKNAAGGGTERVISSSILVVSLYDGVVTPSEDELHEHTYIYDSTTGVLTCSDCQELVYAGAEYYSGWAQEQDTGRWVYFVGGALSTGDVKLEDNSTAYFDADGLALQGEVDILGEICIFEKGVYVSSKNQNVIAAGYTGTNIQWIYYQDGTFKIDGEGAMRDYPVRGGMPWAEYRQNFKRIEIGNGITSVGIYAFNDAIRVTEVIFEEGSQLKSINGSAFYYMYSLKEFHIPDSVTYIGNYAFGYCFALTNVYMPDGLTNVYTNAFNYCDKNDWDTRDLCLIVTEGTYAHDYAIAQNLKYDLKDEDGQILHSWDEGTGVVQPTCTTAGRKHSTCTTCGITADVEIPALGHDWNEVERQEATCTEKGSVTCACTRCSKTKTEEIPAMGHDWNEVERQEASCTEKGYVTYACSRCSKTKTEEIPAMGHNWDAGTVTREATETECGTIVYTCQDCGHQRTEEIPALGDGYENPFTDALEGRFYYDAVKWAVQNSVVQGMTATTFEPMTECTRGHVITFLWRAAGCPEPESTETPFTDLDPTRFYYKAVLWGVEQGIVEGMTETTFEPWSVCTRAQVVTFLYRYAGKPEVNTTETKFTDLDPTRFYYNAVLWADETGIANGMTATTFEPWTECTRGHVVTFLYRLVQNNLES